MSTSQHPVALRLEHSVGRGTRLLATVMALPLIDGIFPALVLAGTLGTWYGIVEMGVLVFGGSATLAVVLAEMEGSRRQQVVSILALGVVLASVAAVEAAFAPAFEAVLRLEIFSRFAALVILAIAAKTASATVGEYLPSPGTIVVLGLVASIDPSGLQGLVLHPDLDNALRGAAAAGAGVSFALSAALFGPTLRRYLDLDRFRFGSAIALGILPLTILGWLEANVPLALAVFLVAILLAIDPDGDAEGVDTGTDPAEMVQEAAQEAAQEATGAAHPTATDGGEDSDDHRSRDPEAERAPWL